MSLRLLITGANGQVGWHLQRALAPLGSVTALTRDQLDLANPDAVSRAVREAAPDILVNAAAYTAVDKAESEPELARAINAAAPARMAQELADTGGLLIHYSTDYVFDGTTVGAYTEEDSTAPLNVYGKTKLEGEHGIAGSGCAYVILRTTWVYDIRGKNFLRTVIRLARDREELRMVGDQHGAPTWARTIAEATAAVITKRDHHRDTEEQRKAEEVEKDGQKGQQQRKIGRERKAWPCDKSGIFHLTAGGVTTWAGFAEAILENYRAMGPLSGGEGEYGAPLKAERVVPIATAEYPTPARRPENSVLSNAKIQAVFGIQMPDWRSQLRLAMQDAFRR